MSTIPNNNVRFGLVSPEGFMMHPHVPVASATSVINQGDLVYWNASSHIAEALDSDAHGANLLGVALQSNVLSSPIDNNQSNPITSIQVGFGVIAMLNTTSGDTYHDGDSVYFGTDAQTITNTVGGNTHILGCVRLNPAMSAVAGGAGIQVPVLVYSYSFVAFHS